MLTLYQANVPTLTRCNFSKKHTPKLIIFGIHNLQTFKQNTLISNLFNIRPKLHHQKWRLRVTLPVNWRNMHAIFSVCSLRDDIMITSKPTWKLIYANSILEPSEYFCQMSSKSILIISSYTVSKLVHFFWDTVYKCSAKHTLTRISSHGQPIWHSVNWVQNVTDSS